MASSPRSQVGFRDLPAEIRNKIYGLVFKSTKVDIIRSIQNHTLSVSGSLPRVKLLRRPRVFGPQPDLSQAQLLLTCKAIREETLPLLYSSTTFCFHSAKCLKLFLNTIPANGLRAVESIQIRHTTYGEPLLAEMRIWKTRADEGWLALCTRLAQELTSLRRVSLDLKISENIPQLNSQVLWIKSILVLKCNGLDEARILLRNHSLPIERLQKAAKNMEKHILTDEARKRKELQEAKEKAIMLRRLEAKSTEAEDEKPDARTTKTRNNVACLTIDMNDIPLSSISRKTAPRFLNAEAIRHSYYTPC